MNAYLIVKHFILALFLTLAAYTDVKERRISNKMLLVMLLIGMIFTVATLDISEFITAGLGLLLAAVLFLPSYFFSKGGLGAGDVKLALCMGLFAGLLDFINIMIYTLLYTVIVGIGLMVIKRKNIKTRLPFAPYTLAGCLTNIIFYVVTNLS